MEGFWYVFWVHYLTYEPLYNNSVIWQNSSDTWVNSNWNFRLGGEMNVWKCEHVSFSWFIYLFCKAGVRVKPCSSIRRWTNYCWAVGSGMDPKVLLLPGERWPFVCFALVDCQEQRPVFFKVWVMTCPKDRTIPVFITISIYIYIYLSTYTYHKCNLRSIHPADHKCK